MALESINGISSGIESAVFAARQAQFSKDSDEFALMMKRVAGESAAEQSAPIARRGRLGGDYTSGFQGAFTSPLDKAARPQGMAHNAPRDAVIDKTSELYEAALEFESYMVKIMLSSMRSSVMKSTALGSEQSFASKMYEDMLYAELAVTMTQNAGFGLADQISLELARDSNVDVSA
jgi:flagellar protein FlgJ